MAFSGFGAAGAGAEMRSIFGVRVPVVKARDSMASVRFALPRKPTRGRGGARLTYEFRQYASWAEAERQTGLTIAKLRWDILKFLREFR